MRRSVLIGMLATLALGASACGGGGDVAVNTNHRRPELLYLGSRSAITAVSPTSGHVRFQSAGAVPSRDWSVLYAATNDGFSTTLRTLDPATASERSRRTIAGVFAVRVVSENGDAVALTPPPPQGFDTYHPTIKDPTPIVIVRRGDPEPRVLSVPGNVEPEAFSLAGDALFVIDFVPPRTPERYRVARLVLGAGVVEDVRSKEQELQAPMRGTARAQVMAPDGRRLYTLYVRDATATDPAKAFVHVLDLDKQQASCVDLPAEFASNPVSALAVSPSGAHLYVIAPALGQVADLDTGALTIARTASIPTTATGPTGATARAAATSTTLYVSVDQQINALTLDQLTAPTKADVPGIVIGIKPSTDGTLLYVSLTDRVLLLDARTLVQQRELVVPTGNPTDPINHVAPALPPIDGSGYVKCAC